MVPRASVHSTDAQFGMLLRVWRTNRRLTQLELALEAGVSPRHVGFLECGRASPSRGMVLTLAEALEIPLREQNVLLLAAGFAPIFRESDLAAPDMAAIHTALELILRRHEPFGAIAVTRRWDVVMANRPQATMLTGLIGRDVPAFQILETPRANVLQLLFEPTGLRQQLVNWEAVARETLHRARREAQWARDAQLEAIVRDLSEKLPSSPDSPDSGGSALFGVEVRAEGSSLKFFSTFATLGAPQDVTLQELRIEAFHPADAATDEAIRRQFESLVPFE